jgi:hypothetical protein
MQAVDSNAAAPRVMVGVLIASSAEQTTIRNPSQLAGK